MSKHKYHNRKPPMAMIPQEALRRIASVMGHGAEKYPEPKWIKLSDVAHLNAALRHISEHLRGNYRDIQSGLPHLAHAATRLIFAMETGGYQTISDDGQRMAKSTQEEYLKEKREMDEDETD